MPKRIGLLVGLMSLWCVLPAVAAKVTLSWTPPTTNADGSALEDLAGYRVYYAIDPGRRTTMVEAGNQPTLIVSGLIEGQVYVFTVTALDTSENESGFAKEVIYTVLAAPAPPIKPIPPIEEPPVEPSLPPMADNCLVSLWAATEVPATVAADDGQAVELGLKFRSAMPGQVLGVRYYKSEQNTGTHTASLWSSKGKRLARATFDETQNSGRGWKTVLFSAPIPIEAQTVYIVSYYAPQGHYAVDPGDLATARTVGPLTALSDGTDGGNGVYKYGRSGFPTETWQASQYWVDVLFIATP